MKYKACVYPKPSKGQRTSSEKLVVPNQALSLQEILQRFTRNEAVAVGKDAKFHESEDDLEKIAHGDLVDRQEFADRLKDVQSKYERQEKKRQEDERKRIEAEALEKARKELEKPASGESAK